MQVTETEVMQTQVNTTFLDNNFKCLLILIDLLSNQLKAFNFDDF